MRWTHFIFLQSLLIAVVGVVVYIHKDKVNIHKTPPASLAKWYMPENKRQEWLHNMFKVRREIQAVKLYSTSNEDELLGKLVDLANLRGGHDNITIILLSNPGTELFEEDEEEGEEEGN